MQGRMRSELVKLLADSRRAWDVGVDRRSGRGAAEGEGGLPLGSGSQRQALAKGGGQGLLRISGQKSWEGSPLTFALPLPFPSMPLGRIQCSSEESELQV